MTYARDQLAARIVAELQVLEGLLSQSPEPDPVARMTAARIQFRDTVRRAASPSECIEEILTGGAVLERTAKDAIQLQCPRDAREEIEALIDQGRFREAAREVGRTGARPDTSPLLVNVLGANTAPSRDLDEPALLSLLTRMTHGFSRG